MRNHTVESCSNCPLVARTSQKGDNFLAARCHPSFAGSQVWDEDSKAHYFYDDETGATQWEKPDGFEGEVRWFGPLAHVKEELQELDTRPALVVPTTSCAARRVESTTAEC